MFNLLKRKKVIDYNKILSEHTHIETSVNSITDFNNLLIDVSRQINNGEKVLSIRDFKITDVKKIELIQWIVDEDGYLINDVNEIINSSIKTIKNILTYHNNIKSKQSVSKINYNYRRLTPLILEITIFKNIFKID